MKTKVFILTFNLSKANMLPSVFKKFTTYSKEAIKVAFVLANELNHKNVGPEHILYGLIVQKGSLGAEILFKAKLNLEQVKNLLPKNSTFNSSFRNINLSLETKKIIEKAVLLAHLNHHKYIGTEHLLYGLLEIKDPKIRTFFEEQKINIDDLKEQVIIILKSTSKFPELADALESLKNKEESPGELLIEELTLTKTKTSSFLELFAVNLTNPKIQKKIDPVIGREEEITRLIQILCRRTKNNPVLLGDAGVGKTAIVEGLAKKIILGEVPDILLGKTIYALDLGLVVAGTSFRGEFENRVKQIIAEIKQNPNIILFIDELHNIAGAGSATGSMDAGNILKPALARGEIRCIGATTLEDYKKHIESDSALERRFQPIYINQPSIQKTIEILTGIKENYQTYHQVIITDEATAAAAILSERYLPDKFLPDKAIDLIDEAAAAIKISLSDSGVIKDIKQLEKELDFLKDKKQKAVIAENFHLALSFKRREEEKLNKLATLKKQAASSQKFWGKVGKKEIVQVIAKITGIPLNDIVAEEKNRLLNLEKLIGKRIVGQEAALKVISEFIRRSRTGIADSRRPIGSFVFLGPTGVGKTELAKTLAAVVFGNSDSLIRIDMSEFAESFNLSKLIGAPPGYVGFRETNKLTDAVKRKPYSVILFDEIEKAHHEVFNLLLQVLEDGQLTDAVGKKINFRNTIIIMTSNIGSESLNKQAVIGFQAKTEKDKESAQEHFLESKEEILKNLKKHFRPEFLNRIDKIIVLNPLTPQNILEIVELQIKELNKRLKKEKGLGVKLDKKAKDFLAKISYSPEEGARAVRKNILELIENPLAEKILLGEIKPGYEIKIKLKDLLSCPEPS